MIIKPEDFHIYKERAITGNPWLGMDMAAMTAELERWEKNYKNSLNYQLAQFVEALGKQIPKKIVREFYEIENVVTHKKYMQVAELCPTCGEELHDGKFGEIGHYCCNCGQALIGWY